MTDEQLTGYFLTEDDGRMLRVFPGSERLRYTIPFRRARGDDRPLPRSCRALSRSGADFGDDGEKFGTWPDTKEHVYDRGWLRAFFDALSANADWLQTITLAEAVPQHAAGRQDLSARLQLSRDDRVVAAGRAARVL